jgi:hypothetical protein
MNVDPEVTANGKHVSVSLPMGRVVALVIIFCLASAGALWRFENRMNRIERGLSRAKTVATQARDEARGARAAAERDNDRQDREIQELRGRMGRRPYPTPTGEADKPDPNVGEYRVLGELIASWGMV